MKYSPKEANQTIQPSSNPHETSFNLHQHQYFSFYKWYYKSKKTQDIISSIFKRCMFKLSSQYPSTGDQAQPLHLMTWTHKQLNLQTPFKSRGNSQKSSRSKNKKTYGQPNFMNPGAYSKNLKTSIPSKKITIYVQAA